MGTSITAEAMQKLSAFSGTVKMNGFCVRLPSHDKEGDGDNSVRGRLRAIGLRRLLRSLEKTP